MNALELVDFGVQCNLKMSRKLTVTRLVSDGQSLASRVNRGTCMIVYI